MLWLTNYARVAETHYNKSNRTFIIVTLLTGTNFPAVSLNCLLAVAMMKSRQRWNGTGVPIQSHPQAASLTLCAWNSYRVIPGHHLSIKLPHDVRHLSLTCSVSSVPRLQNANTHPIINPCTYMACARSVWSSKLCRKEGVFIPYAFYVVNFKVVRNLAYSTSYYFFSCYPTCLMFHIIIYHNHTDVFSAAATFLSLKCISIKKRCYIAN
jgi:hypothetical protein